jgi:antirestriction protein ArdC
MAWRKSNKNKKEQEALGQKAYLNGQEEKISQGPVKPDVLESRKETVAELCRLIQENKAPWQKPWQAGDIPMPYNPVSKTNYRGYNRLVLSMCDYADARWVSFLQAHQKGWWIPNGAKAQPIEFWQWTAKRRILDKTGRPVRDEDGNPVEYEVNYTRPWFKRFYVFNVSQLITQDGSPMPGPDPPRILWQPQSAIEELIKATGAKIAFDRVDRCFYDHKNDQICMPQKGHFFEAGGYYSSLFHELAHWTRHPDRLNREKTMVGQSYAREELRAEIAAWMLCQELAVDFSPDNHAAYCQHWINDLSGDPSEIVRACLEAEKIKEYLLAPVAHLKFKKAIMAVDRPEDRAAGPKLVQVPPHNYSPPPEVLAALAVLAGSSDGPAVSPAPISLVRPPMESPGPEKKPEEKEKDSPYALRIALLQEKPEEEEEDLEEGLRNRQEKEMNSDFMANMTLEKAIEIIRGKPVNPVSPVSPVNPAPLELPPGPPLEVEEGGQGPFAALSLERNYPLHFFGYRRLPKLTADSPRHLMEWAGKTREELYSFIKLPNRPDSEMSQPGQSEDGPPVDPLTVSQKGEEPMAPDHNQNTLEKTDLTGVAAAAGRAAGPKEDLYHPEKGQPSSQVPPYPDPDQEREEDQETEKNPELTLDEYLEMQASLQDEAKYRSLVGSEEAMSAEDAALEVSPEPKQPVAKATEAVLPYFRAEQVQGAGGAGAAKKEEPSEIYQNPWKMKDRNEHHHLPDGVFRNILPSDEFTDPDYYESRDRLEEVPTVKDEPEWVKGEEIRLMTLNKIVTTLCRPGLALSGASRWSQVNNICIDSLGTNWAGEERFSQFLRETKRICEYQMDICHKLFTCALKLDWERREVSVNNSLLLVIDAGRQMDMEGFIFPRNRPNLAPFDYVPLTTRSKDDTDSIILTIGGQEFDNFRIAMPDETPRGFGVMRKDSFEILNIFKSEVNANDFAWSLGRPDTPMLRQHQDQEFFAQFCTRLVVKDGLPKSDLPTDSDLAALNQKLFYRSQKRGRGEPLTEPLFSDEKEFFPPVKSDLSAEKTKARVQEIPGLVIPKPLFPGPTRAQDLTEARTEAPATAPKKTKKSPAKEAAKNPIETPLAEKMAPDKSLKEQAEAPQPGPTPRM